MSERSIFDEECVRQAFIAFDPHSGNVTQSLRAALRAAEASLIARGSLKIGKCYDDMDGDGGDDWDATTGGVAEPGGFPVAIIKLSEGE